jgi:hypothetical protein
MNIVLHGRGSMLQKPSNTTIIYNWLFEQNLQVMKYNEITEEYHTNDGEIYTADCIIREVEKNG